MEKIRITAESIKTLPAPAEGEATYWDDTISGFGIRIRSTGGRSFIFKYRVKGDPKVCRITIGDADGMKAKDARDKAADLRALVRQGKDPQRDKIEDRAKRGNTFGAMVDRYLEWKAVTPSRKTREVVRERTQAAAKHTLQVLCKDLLTNRIDKIGRADLAGTLAKIESKRGPTAKARAYAVLSDFFRWALADECVIDVSPLAAIRKPDQGKARKRVLTPDELAAIWNACGDDDFGRVVRLLILTLQRRNEIGGAEWRELDRDNAVLNIVGERVKNGRDHSIPLVPTALEIIEKSEKRQLADGSQRQPIFGQGDGGFSGWSKAKSALDQRIARVLGKPLEPWVLHDLRRTGRTGLSKIGIRPEVAEAVLNHVSSVASGKAGVAAVYDHYDYTPEKRDALLRWTDYVNAIVTGKAHTIVALKRA